jgi:hypothetical protein
MKSTDYVAPTSNFPHSSVRKLQVFMMIYCYINDVRGGVLTQRCHELVSSHEAFGPKFCAINMVS